MLWSVSLPTGRHQSTLLGKSDPWMAIGPELCRGWYRVGLCYVSDLLTLTPAIIIIIIIITVLKENVRKKFSNVDRVSDLRVLPPPYLPQRS